MHQAAIHGIGLVGDKLQQGNPYGKEDHHIVTIAPSGVGKVIDLNLHTTMKHHGLVIARVMVTKVNNPNHLSRHTTIHVMEMRGISSRMHE
jgi:hypothetical protein